MAPSSPGIFLLVATLLLWWSPGNAQSAGSAATLRLVNGSSPFEGRVEILYNGTWGTVCSDGFEVAEARVACRQLGLPDAGALPLLNATFGSGTGPIWLTKLRCWGFEPTLANCNTPMTGINGCNHAMDAGVRCLVPSPSPPPPPLPPAPPAPPPRPLAAAVTCRVVVIGRRVSGALLPANATVLSADVDCVGSSGSSSSSSLVDVAVGRALLPFTAGWTGVRVTARAGDEGWGMTMANVPHMVWRDSLLQDLPLNQRALLQCINCTRLEAVNMTLSGIRGVGASLGTLHGPLHATSLRSAALERFTCTNVRGGNGWACVMLQYDTSEPDTDLRLDISDSVFVGNSVSRGGLYGTHGSTRDTATPVGHGMIVAGGADPLASHPDAFGTWVEGSALVVRLRGVTAEDNGGGMGTFFSSIDLPVGLLSVQNCSLRNNTAAGDGGVFWVWGPLSGIELGEGSSMDNNTAALSGGAVMVGARLDSLTLTGGSSISGNRAVQWQGGGVWANDLVGRVELRGGSAMDGNSAGWSGGAFANSVRGIGLVLLADGSSMSYNAAKLRGGAVATDVDIGNVTLEGGSAMSGNSAGQHGGAVAAERGLKRLSLAGGSEMRGNVAAAGGGALGVPSGAVDAVVLEGGSNIVGCRSIGGDGGAVWAARGLRELRVTGGSAIDDNAAPAGAGGAVAVTSGAVGIVTLADGGRLCGNAAGGGNGGALSVSASVGTFTASGAGSGVCNNTAAGNGGGVAVGGSVLAELSLSDGAAASGNAAAAGSGAGIWVSGTVNTLRFTGGAEVRGNEAAVSGGGVWVGGGVWSLAIRNGSAVSGNAAGNGTGAGLCVGGAVRTWLLDGGSELSGNTALAGSGGGAWVGGPVTTLTVTSGGRLEANLAAGDGGAIWVGGRLGNVSLADGAVGAANRAGGDGGLLYAAAGVAVFAAGGGARLERNFAGMHGGVLAAEEVPTLLRLDGGAAVTNNTAKRGQGGAFSLRASGAAVNATVAISGGASLLGNTAGLSGGALYLAAAESYDSQADTSTAAKAGGGATVSTAGAAGFVPATAATATWTVHVTDATLSNNAAGWAGGAMLASAASRAALTLRLSNCTLLGNHAGDGTSSVDSVWRDGGALAVAGLVGGGGAWTDAAAAANATGASGADVDVDVDSAWQAAVRAAAPGSCSVLLAGSRFGSSVSGGSGGAVFLGYCQALVAGCSFDSNAAAMGGGALAVTGPPAPSLGSASAWQAVSVRGSNFSRNAASQGNGGALAASTGGAVRLNGCALKSNTAGGGGGAIAAVLPTASSSASSSSSVASTSMGSGGGSSGAGGGGAGAGDGASNVGSPLELVDCRLEANSAQANGGGIYAGTLAAVTLRRCSLDGNAAVQSGGGLAVSPPAVAALAAAAAVASNVAAFAAADAAVAAAASAGGAATMVAAATTALGGTGRVELVDSAITGNNAQASGGGLFFATLASVRLANVTLVTNRAGLYGGALAALPPRVADQSALLTSDAGSSSNSSSNTDRSSGGAARPAGCSSGSSLELAGCTLRENAADASGGGAFVYLLPGTCGVRLYETDFESNAAGQTGGGAAVLSLPGVSHCAATAAAAAAGVESAGGGAGAAVAAVAAAGVSLRGGRFAGNSAKSSGGGLYTSTPCSVGVNGTRFESNFAQQLGGGLAQLQPAGAVGATTAAGSLAVLRAVFASNTVRGQGGGVYVGTTTAVWIAESIFSSNRADQQGGALAVAPPDSYTAAAGGGGDVAEDGGAFEVAAVEVLSSNFTQNSVKSSGGAIFANRGGSVALAACSFVGNSAAQAGGAVAVAPPPSPTDAQLLGASAAAEAADGDGDQDNRAAAASNTATGLSSSGARLTLLGCTLTENGAAGLDGGGVYAAGGVAAALLNSTFAGNTAARNGGGAALVLQLDVLDHSAASASPASSASSSSSSASASASASPSFAASLALAKAAFYRSHSRVQGCRFVANVASHCGGGLLWAAPGTLAVSDSAFSGNVVTGGAGGGLAAYPPDHQPGLQGEDDSWNTDSPLGLLSDMAAAGITVSSRNRTGGSSSSGSSSGSAPGQPAFVHASPLLAAALSVTGCSFTTNRASDTGGGLHLTLSRVTLAAVNLTGVRVRDGAAGAAGGGLAALCPEHTCGDAASDAFLNVLAAARATIRNGSAAYVAAAAAAAAATDWYGDIPLPPLLRLTNVSLVANAVSGTGAGGAPPLRSGAAAAGGGAALDGLLRAVATWLEVCNNSVTLPAGGGDGGGGGVYVGVDASVIAYGSWLVRNALVSPGGTGGGGGWHADNCSLLLLSGAQVTGSSSHGSTGGGLHLDGCSTLMLTDVRVEGNAAGAGAGVYISGRLAPNTSDAASGAAGGRAATVMAAAAGGGGGTIAFVHRATLAGNAAAAAADSTGDAADGADRPAAAPLPFEGFGGGLMVVGPVALALSRSDLSRGNAAARGAAIMSTQQCSALRNSISGGPAANSNSSSSSNRREGDIVPIASSLLRAFADGFSWGRLEGVPAPAAAAAAAAVAHLDLGSSSSPVAALMAPLFQGLLLSRNLDPTLGCWPLVIVNCRLPYGHDAAGVAAAAAAGGAAAQAASPGADAQQAARSNSSGSLGANDTTGDASTNGSSRQSSQLWLQDSYASAVWAACDPALTATPEADASMGAATPSAFDLFAARRLPAALATVAAGAPRPEQVAAAVAVLRARGVNVSIGAGAGAAAGAAPAPAPATADAGAGAGAATAQQTRPELLRSLAMCRIPVFSSVGLPAMETGATANATAGASGAADYSRLLKRLLQPVLDDSGFLALPPAGFRITLLQRYDANAALSPGGSGSSNSSGGSSSLGSSSNDSNSRLRLMRGRDVGGVPSYAASYWALPTGTKLRIGVQLVNGLGVPTGPDDAWQVVAELSLAAASGASPAARRLQATAAVPPPASSSFAASTSDGPPLAILESRALEVAVRNGTAEWEQVVASGWPGMYELVVSAVAVSGVSVEVAPLREPVLLLPCAAGQQLDASRVTPGSPAWTACSACQPDQYSFWADARPLAPAPAPAYGPAPSTARGGGSSSGNGTAAAVYDGGAGAPLAAAGLGAIAPDAGAAPAALYGWVRETAAAAAQCRNCPDRAICPGGAVVVPQPGFWHSSPNSTLMHRCPKPAACLLVAHGTAEESSGATAAAFLASLTSAANASAFFAAATAAGYGPGGSGGVNAGSGELRSRLLLLCQQQWYASRPPGAGALAGLAAPPPLAPPSRPPFFSGAGTAAAAPAAGASGGAPSALPPTKQQQQPLQPLQPQQQQSQLQPLPCYLWGVPADHPGSYMQLQCAPGYTGQLCASCQRGYFLTSDLDCAQCLSVPATAALVTLGVLGNAALVLYTAWTNLKDGIGLHTDVSAADVLKVAIVHMQYFVIICRLNIDWPNVITRFQGTLGALTGAQGKFISAPSCLAPNADPGEQARMQLFAGLITPTVVIGLVVALWTLRYRLGKYALRGRQAAILGAAPSGGRRRSSRRRRHRGSDDDTDSGDDDKDEYGKGGGTPVVGVKPPRGWMAKGAESSGAALVAGPAASRQGCSRRLVFGEEGEASKAGSSAAAYPAIGGATAALVGSPPAAAAAAAAARVASSAKDSNAVAPQSGVYNDSVYDRAGDDPTKGASASALPSGTSGAHTACGSAQEDALAPQGRQSQSGIAAVKVAVQQMLAAAAGAAAGVYRATAPLQPLQPARTLRQEDVVSSDTAFESRSADVLDSSVRRAHSSIGAAAGAPVTLATIADVSDGCRLSTADRSLAPIASGDEPPPPVTSGCPPETPLTTALDSGSLPFPSPFAAAHGAGAADAARLLRVQVAAASADAADATRDQLSSDLLLPSPKTTASRLEAGGAEGEDGSGRTAVVSPRAAARLAATHRGVSASGFVGGGGAGGASSPSRLRAFNGMQLRQLAHRLGGGGGCGGGGGGSRRGGAGPASGGGTDTQELISSQVVTAAAAAVAAAAAAEAAAPGGGAASIPIPYAYCLLASGRVGNASTSTTLHVDFTADGAEAPPGEPSGSAAHTTTGIADRGVLLRPAAGADAPGAATHSGAFGALRSPFGAVKATVLTEDTSAAFESTHGSSAGVASSCVAPVTGMGVPDGGGRFSTRGHASAFAAGPLGGAMSLNGESFTSALKQYQQQRLQELEQPQQQQQPSAQTPATPSGPLPAAQLLARLQPPLQGAASCGRPSPLQPAASAAAAVVSLLRRANTLGSEGPGGGRHGGAFGLFGRRGGGGDGGASPADGGGLSARGSLATAASAAPLSVPLPSAAADVVFGEDDEEQEQDEEEEAQEELQGGPPAAGPDAGPGQDGPDADTKLSPFARQHAYSDAPDSPSAAAAGGAGVAAAFAAATEASTANSASAGAAAGAGAAGEGQGLERVTRRSSGGSDDPTADAEYMVIVPAEVYLLKKGGTAAAAAAVAAGLAGTGGTAGAEAAAGAAGLHGADGGNAGQWQRVPQLERVPVALRPVVRRAATLARSLSLNALSGAAALERVDVMLGLGDQLRMVVMVALFVLYAGWSQVALSVFACHVIDDGQGPYGELQRATWRQGYWLRDINQECYAGVHGSLYLPVGIAAVLAVCVAPPAASFVMLWRVRHRLDEPATQHLYGFLYLRYKPRYFYYECIVQLQTLCLVAVDVFGRGLPVLQQALLLLVVFNLIAAINMTAAPVRFRLLLVLEFVSLGVLSTTVTLGLFFVDGGGTTTGDGTAIGIAILLLNSGLLLFMATMLLRQYKERLAARGRDWLGRAKKTIHDIRPGAADAAAAADRAYLGRLQAEAQRRHPDLAPEVTCFADVHGAHGGGAMWVAGPPPASTGMEMGPAGAAGVAAQPGGWGFMGGMWGGVWGSGGAVGGHPAAGVAAGGGGGGNGAAAAHYPPVLAADLDIIGASGVDAMCGGSGGGGGGSGSGSGSGGCRFMEPSLQEGMGVGGGAATGRYPAVGSENFTDAPTVWGMPYGVEPIQGASMYDSNPTTGGDNDAAATPQALAPGAGGAANGGTATATPTEAALPVPTAFALSPHRGPKTPPPAFRSATASAGAAAAARLSLEEAQRVAADALAASALAVSLFPHDDDDGDSDAGGSGRGAAAPSRAAGRRPQELLPSNGSVLQGGGGSSGGGGGSGGGLIGTAASVGSKLRASLRRQFSTGVSSGGGSAGAAGVGPAATGARGDLVGGAGAAQPGTGAAVLPTAQVLTAAQAPALRQAPAPLPAELSAAAGAGAPAPGPLASAFAAVGRGRKLTATPSRLGRDPAVSSGGLAPADPPQPLQPQLQLPQAYLDASAPGGPGDASPVSPRPFALQLPGGRGGAEDSGHLFHSPGAASSGTLYATPGGSGSPCGSPGPSSPTAHSQPWAARSHAPAATSPAVPPTHGSAAARGSAGGAASIGVQQPSRLARMGSARDATASGSLGGFAQPAAAAGPSTAPGYRNAEQQPQLLKGRGSGGGLLKSLGSWRGGSSTGLLDTSPKRGGQQPRGRQPQPQLQEQMDHHYDFSDLMDN